MLLVTMSDEKVNHLFKAASLISRLEEYKSYDILKSYYLMRCPILSTNNILDGKRCSHCCLEFKRNDKCKIKSIKLSKKQKQRLKSHRGPNLKEDPRKSNKMEVNCSFCGHLNSINVPKYRKKYEGNYEKKQIKDKSDTASTTKVMDLKQNEKCKSKTEIQNKTTINVYSKASEIFSMKNEDNKLATPKEPVQIKNNKKKKDKFAGLCQKAVSEAAKMKEKKDKDTNNKLNLFLKPSV